MISIPVTEFQKLMPKQANLSQDTWIKLSSQKHNRIRILAIGSFVLFSDY